MFDHYPFAMPALPYRSLAPAVSDETLAAQIARLQADTNALNGLLEPMKTHHQYPLITLCNARRPDLRKLAQTVYCQRFFLEGMAQSPKRLPRGRLAEAIRQSYGSFDNWKSTLLKCQTNTWRWLAWDGRRLRIVWGTIPTMPIVALAPGCGEEWLQTISWPTADARFFSYNYLPSNKSR
ncbi:MAG: hypothetical protein IJ493_02090 [Clostridia bacterium]|nr:hypothetical protein [Clostridia bacterium]